MNLKRSISSLQNELRMEANVAFDRIAYDGENKLLVLWAQAMWFFENQGRLKELVDAAV